LIEHLDPEQFQALPEDPGSEVTEDEAAETQFRARFEDVAFFVKGGEPAGKLI
jgi:hypothetical protein